MVGDWSREPMLAITGRALNHGRLASVALQVEGAGRLGVAGMRVLLQVPPAGNIGILENLKKYQIPVPNHTLFVFCIPCHQPTASSNAENEVP
jgi:hypothetical protein